MTGSVYSSTASNLLVHTHSLLDRDAGGSECINFGRSEFASADLVLEQDGQLLVGSVPCLRKTEVTPHDAECCDTCPEKTSLCPPIPVACQRVCSFTKIRITYQLPGFNCAGSKKLLIMPIMLYTEYC